MSGSAKTLNFKHPVILSGPGDLDFGQLEKLAEQGFTVIAADGGANALLGRGIVPNAIIGDFDSVDEVACQGKGIKLVRLNEQNSTDFEKCLYSIKAPLFLALGFTGGRFDHTLAALHVMMKYRADKPVILLSGSDISFVQCGEAKFKSRIKQTISIFPLEAISFERSRGLEYALDGLTFELGSHIGISNRAIAENIQILPAHNCLKTPYLMTLPNCALDDIIEDYL